MARSKGKLVRMRHRWVLKAKRQKARKKVEAKAAAKAARAKA
jgi:hypothetical protein